MLQDLAALTPPLIVCVAFLIGVGVLVRRELGPRRRARADAARGSGEGEEPGRALASPGPGSASGSGASGSAAPDFGGAETAPDRGEGSQT